MNEAGIIASLVSIEVYKGRINSRARYPLSACQASKEARNYQRLVSFIVNGHQASPRCSPALFTISFLPYLSLCAVPPNLKPWEVTTLGTGYPSGWAGNSPYLSVHISITDPNTIPAGPFGTR